MATNPDYLDWPFFEARHRALASELDAWATRTLGHGHGEDRAAVDAACRGHVRALGQAGWLGHAIAGREHGGAADAIDTRSICLARETLARHDGLADFAFAMQGLGSGAISLAGTAEQKATPMPAVQLEALIGLRLYPRYGYGRRYARGTAAGDCQIAAAANYCQRRAVIFCRLR